MRYSTFVNTFLTPCSSCPQSNVMLQIQTHRQLQLLKSYVEVITALPNVAEQTPPYLETCKKNFTAAAAEEHRARLTNKVFVNLLQQSLKCLHCPFELKFLEHTAQGKQSLQISEADDDGKELEINSTAFQRTCREINLKFDLNTTLECSSQSVVSLLRSSLLMSPDYSYHSNHPVNSISEQQMLHGQPSSQNQITHHAVFSMLYLILFRILHNLLTV